MTRSKKWRLNCFFSKMSTSVIETSFQFKEWYSESFWTQSKTKRIEKRIFPHGNKIYMQSSLNIKGWHEGGSFVTLETLNFFKKDFYPEIRNSSKLSFFSPHFPTVIRSIVLKKSPASVDRIKINFCKQLFLFRESELSNTFCKLHVLTYFTSVSFFFAAITQSSQEPAPGHRRYVF